MKENKKSRNWFNIEYRHIQNKKLVVTVSVLLRLSVVGTLVAQAFNGNFENVYTCILALILFTIPSLIERRLHIDLPDTLEIIILFFIYAAEILGEIQEYYVIIPFWDDILHTLNGFLFAAVGFSLVNILNRDKRVMLRLSPFYMAVMAFCGTFGIDPGDPAGDVSAWQWEDALYLRANTEKGAALLAGLPLEEGEESAVAAAQERTRSILNRLPLRELTTEGFGREEAMLELFHRPEWDQLSESCLGCGACTFACPTCQCYDIKEFTGNREILRYRCWDSCMYSDFTIMSAGQPRPTQKERFRQRFLHKLQYFPVNQGGIFGCVGCGRCLRQCPIHMNIVKVMKTLGGAPHES